MKVVALCPELTPTIVARSQVDATETGPSEHIDSTVLHERPPRRPPEIVVCPEH